MEARRSEMGEIATKELKPSPTDSMFPAPIFQLTPMLSPITINNNLPCDCNE
jgi:hypothetical protein